MDARPVTRCVGFVGARLAEAIRRHERRPSNALARRIRSLELLTAACLAEAVRSEAVVPRHEIELRSPPGGRTDPALRGAWERPDR